MKIFGERVLGFCGGAMLCAAAVCWAEQFTLFDKIEDINTKWEFVQTFNPDAPHNFETPVNYRGGRIHVIYTILKKEGTGQQDIRICWHNQCNKVIQRLAQEVKFTAPGVYETEETVEGMKMQHGEQGPWSWEQTWCYGWTECMTSSPPFTLHFQVAIMSQGTEYDSVLLRTALPPKFLTEAGTYDGATLEIELEEYRVLGCDTIDWSTIDEQCGQFIGYSYTPDAQVRYTLDGTEPTEESTEYTEPFSLDMTSTVKMRTFCEGYHPSDIVSASYVLPNGKPVSARCKAPLARPGLGCTVSGNSVRVTVPFESRYSLALVDGRGRVVERQAARGPGVHSFSADVIGPGVYRLIIDDSGARTALPVVLVK
jgi:hypothetical protein